MFSRALKKRGVTLASGMRLCVKSSRNKYAKELEDRGLTAILKLGIAFSGKEVCMKSLC
jgi:hypothetical protein